jgi:hypothetical protein
VYHEFTLDISIGPNAADVLVTALVCYGIVATIVGLALLAMLAFRANGLN